MDDPRRMSEREYFANVAKRLGMYVSGARLAGVEASLDGYDQHPPPRRPRAPGVA
ncbi:hypothetical protein [Actinoallomurus iriomotensis]|uniref:hypothetical protein n=1 Tax=Actinoallomurus iriomotensis TaxID=478107 RepID=UPI002553A499|nr:hypothetical protein [Actinoallomurus iriomotensis]